MKCLFFVPILSFFVAFCAHADGAEMTPAGPAVEAVPSIGRGSSQDPQKVLGATMTEFKYYEVQKIWLQNWGHRTSNTDLRWMDEYKTQKGLIDALAEMNQLPLYEDMWRGIQLQLQCDRLRAKGSFQAESDTRAVPTGGLSEMSAKIALEKALKSGADSAKGQDLRKVLPNENCDDIFCEDCSNPRREFYEYLKLKTFMNEKSLEWVPEESLQELLDGSKPKH